MSDAHFSTKVVESLDGTVIYVEGEIDMATAARLRDAIEPHMAPRQVVVLDFHSVRFMDSSCLTVLVQTRGRLTADGGSLVLRNPSEIARRLLSASGIESILLQDAADHLEADPDGRQPGQLA